MSADPTGLVARLRKLDCCAMSDALDQSARTGCCDGAAAARSGASRIAAKEEAMAKDILSGAPIGTVMGANYERVLEMNGAGMVAGSGRIFVHGLE